MKAIENPGAAFDFMHAGSAYTCPNGVSLWSDDTARHLQKKRAALGVRIVTVLPGVEAQEFVEPREPAEPVELKPSVEAEPEPPAEPIEDVKKKPKRAYKRRQ